MSEVFGNVIDRMPDLLGQLLGAPLWTRSNLRSVPSHGIYVFYEDGTPIYVGRSNRMRQRLLEHSRPSSGHGSATFAFNLAIEAAKCKKIDMDGKTRTELERYPSFANVYLDQKKGRGDADSSRKGKRPD